MHSLAQSYRKDNFLHHAYLVPSGEEALGEITSFLEETLSIPTRGNPDVVFQKFDTLGIDDSRSLKEFASRRSLSGGRKIFIVVTNFFTREAQNSLLKLFEEPSADTHFFILTPNAETLLPTLKSRLMFVIPEGEGKKGLSKEVEDFLKMPPRLRLESPIITSLIEEKDKQKAILFLDALALELRDRAGADLAPYRSVFEEMLKGRNFLRDRAASIKLILEHLSLIVPVMR